MPNKFAATLAGIPIIISPIQNGLSNSLVKFPTPYQVGDTIKNMGANSESIRFTAYFHNEAYEEHSKIRLLFLKNEEIELVHPEYGKLSGYLESADIRLKGADTQTAEIDISFLPSESQIGESGIAGHEAVKLTTQNHFESWASEQTAELTDTIRDTLSPGAFSAIMDVVIDPSIDIIDQFTTLSGEGRDFVKIADSYVKGLQSSLSSIAQPANSIISVISYATNLPGTVIRAVAQTAERYSVLYEGVKNSPKQFMSSFVDGLKALKSSMPHPKGDDFVSANNIAFNTATTQAGLTAVQSGGISAFQKTMDAGMVAAGMLAVGEIFESDENTRSRQKQKEVSRTFDVLGNYIGAEDAEPLITMQDIEQTLDTIRTEAQSVIDVSRSLQSIKGMARELLEHAKQVKLELERIEEIEIDADIPMHLLMLKHGLPYNVADRVQAINNIRNPNFTEGSVKIYVS